jgi:hypothetical protein
MSHDDSTTPHDTTPTDPQPMSTAHPKPAPPAQSHPNQEPPMTFDDEPIPETIPTAATLARVQLGITLQGLGYDEIRVLSRIADRLAIGARQYGTLDLPTDARAFRAKEAREEIEDALVYFACAWLKGEEAVAA